MVLPPKSWAGSFKTRIAEQITVIGDTRLDFMKQFSNFAALVHASPK